MTEKVKITLEDFSRLTAELVELNLSDPKPWAEKYGIDPDALDKMINGMVNATKAAAEDQAMTAAMERIGMTENGHTVIAVNIGEVIGNATISAFVIGWEACFQFARRSADPT